MANCHTTWDGGPRRYWVVKPLPDAALIPICFIGVARLSYKFFEYRATTAFETIIVAPRACVKARGVYAVTATARTDNGVTATLGSFNFIDHMVECFLQRSSRSYFAPASLFVGTGGEQGF